MHQLIHKEVIIPDDAEVYFVGDIHGSYDLLMRALKEAGFDFEKDYCVSVGDLIDRGPDNYKVLAKFVYGSDRFLAVMGNHDAFLGYVGLDFAFANWMANGGRWILDDHLDTDQLNNLSADIRERLPVFLTINHRGRKYGVVHGGIPNIFSGVGKQEEGYEGLTRNWDTVIAMVGTYVADTKPDLEQMNYLLSPYMWDRDVISAYQGGVMVPPVAGVDFTFHGHTVIKEPAQYTNRVFLDTGGVHYGRMTVAWVDRKYGLVNTVTTNPGGDEPDWSVLSD